MKIDKIYFPLLLFTVLAVGFILGGIFVKTPASNQSSTTNITKQKLNRLIDFIDSDYVENVNTDSIVDQTVTGILEKLDPHSVYIAKNDADLAAQDMRGNFIGIGVNFFIEKDTAIVINPLKGGPSEKAGVKSGDRLLYANNQKLFGNKKNTDHLYKNLKGKQNSEVVLTIYRKSENKVVKLKVYRSTIPLKSVDIALMLKKNIGYIKINRFSETTYSEYYQKLNYLIKKGATSLILDLRDNSGGYMEEAIKITDDFLTKNKLIVFTKDKKGTIDKTFATQNGVFEKGKITILINENSASASEIIAGAIQDNDRGLIIGRRSFGKGLVQREMPFKDGSSVRLTVAKYYTPTGRSIQKSYENGADDYFNDFMQRYNNGELYAKDSIKIADTLKFKTPKGRTVYGGGGIVPDVFVPIEATKGNEIIPIIMQSGLVMNFVFKTIDNDRKVFEKMNYQQILSKINNSDLYFELFKKQVHDSDAYIDLDANKSFVKRYLTAEFCNQLLGEHYFYHLILKEDLMIKTALKN